MADPRKVGREELAPESLPNLCMRAIYRYWLERRGGAALPPVSAIDPVLLPVECLPFLALAEVEHGPLRFRSRLVGTGIVAAVGVDLTGRYADEAPGSENQVARLERCARLGQPYFASDRMTFGPRDYKSYNVLGLPFAGPTGSVDRILLVFEFPDEPPNPSRQDSA